jgi:hypothetical protein
MKRPESLDKHYDVLHKLSCLPRKMLTLHGSENITEFVLHELCNESCFDLLKAAYFVDNPDFDCFRGVAGLSRAQAPRSFDVWKDIAKFSDHMKSSEFNQQVRSLSRCSLKKEDRSEKELAATIAKDLGMKHYNVCSWTMKHDNHGLLIYEKAQDNHQIDEEHLLNGLSLLSFCPIF